MNLFRNLLLLIVLVLVGALVAQLLVQDPGYVLVRYRGTDYTTTLAAALLIGLGVLLAAWLLWKILSMPVAAPKSCSTNPPRPPPPRTRASPTSPVPAPPAPPRRAVMSPRPTCSSTRWPAGIR